jgi:hypothetical protein
MPLGKTFKFYFYVRDRICCILSHILRLFKEASCSCLVRIARYWSLKNNSFAIFTGFKMSIFFNCLDTIQECRYYVIGEF